METCYFGLVGQDIQCFNVKKKKKKKATSLEKEEEGRTLRMPVPFAFSPDTLNHKVGSNAWL